MPLAHNTMRRRVLFAEIMIPLVVASSAVHGTRAIDTSWHAPAETQLNNLTSALGSKGAYGFIFNSSNTPQHEYGVYNWCNMPHVRPTEYVVADKAYELQYVELIHRHHKRTPYASNAFPVESYQWNCEDAHLFLYGEPLQGKQSSPVFRKGHISPMNPFVPPGWIGSCNFPQITSGGLSDSWQHGADLYAVYHDLLGFLPSRNSDYKSSVRHRVTNNVITSQVAGMVVSAMWWTNDPYPLIVEAPGVDSLEPQYPCNSADTLFNSIKSNQNPDWKQHLEASAALFSTLDDISGVPSSDGAFHSSFDHYYDNLSARQCHAKPLPCKLVDGQNSTRCISQDLANAVYRLGNWEYSQIYRDHPSSLPASVASLGVWIGELTSHLRDVMSGSSDIRYFHNIAHDGSLSRLLSVLQINEMVWPGMGAEVVFELYKRKDHGPNPSPTTPVVAPGCHHDNCLRHMLQHPTSASILCQNVTSSTSGSPTSTRSFLAECSGQSRLVSACSCISSTTIKTAPAPSQTPLSIPSRHYIRVLFGGRILQSSNPNLGRMDMLPVEVLIDYLEGLVGKDGGLVKSKCQN